MRRQVRAKVSLLFGIVMVAATIASCGGDAASQQPQETTAATQESTMPSGQATSPASTAVAPGNGGTAVAPVETPENGGAAAGDADVRRAWDAVEIDMSLAMKAEGAERIAALWALVPGNLPLPEQWFDLEMSSGIGFGWDDCHGGKHPSFGAYWKEQDRFGQPATMEEVVDWFVAEGTGAGWQVTASPYLDWQGEEYGTLLRFSGFGDVWNVIATQDYGVNVTVCPAAR